MRAVCRSMLVLGLGIGLSRCATFRLQGCRKIAACGDRGAYVCDQDLVCADADGRLLRSEAYSTSHKACHICASIGH